MSVLLLAVEAASCCVHAPSSTDSARPEARQRKFRARFMMLELHVSDTMSDTLLFEATTLRPRTIGITAAYRY